MCESHIFLLVSPLKHKCFLQEKITLKVELRWIFDIEYYWWCNNPLLSQLDGWLYFYLRLIPSKQEVLDRVLQCSSILNGTITSFSSLALDFFKTSTQTSIRRFTRLKLANLDKRFIWWLSSLEIRVMKMLLPLAYLEK